MAFALASAYAYPDLVSAPTGRYRGRQIITLNITGTSSDVALDIGNLSGTFWTAAGSSTMGAAVLAAITALYPQFSSVGCNSVACPQLLDRVPVRSLTTTAQYKMDINSTTLLPEISVNAADGETAWSVTMSCPLNLGQTGATFVYPA